MKKSVSVLLTMLSAALVFFLTSCTEETNEPYTEFKDYKTFSVNRAAWVEPDEYSFTYDFRLDRVSYQKPVTVTVKDGEATYSTEDSRDLEYLQTFSSITDVYDYFEKHWQVIKNEENKDLGISFSVKYLKTVGLTYPSILNEDIKWCGNCDAPIGADSGGVNITITDFTVTE